MISLCHPYHHQGIGKINNHNKKSDGLIVMISYAPRNPFFIKNAFYKKA